MFEGIDENTIENANITIKEIYEKFQNSSILSIISKEEIVERDFDNMFIFEDFFDEYLAQNRDVDNFKKDLIQEITDLIDANTGDITIKELYKIITSPKKEEIYVSPIKQESKALDVTNLDLDSDYELVYGQNHRIDLNEIDDFEKINKRITHDLKRDNMDFSSINTKNKKIKLSDGLMPITQQGVEHTWNLFKKNK